MLAWLRRRATPGVNPSVLRHAGMRWEVLPGGEEIVLGRAEWRGNALREEFCDATVHRRNPNRFLLRMQTPSGEVAVKVQVYERFKPRVRSLYGRSSARKEWENHLVAVARGMPAVRPLALGERRRRLVVQEAVLISVWRDGLVRLVEWRRQRADRAGDDEALRLAARFGRLAAQTHEAGIYHNEMHSGNVLIADAGGEPELVLVDWKHARLKPRTAANDAHNLVRTGWFIDRGLSTLVGAPSTDAEKRAFLAAYLEATAARADRAALLDRLRRACPDATWLPPSPEA